MSKCQSDVQKKCTVTLMGFVNQSQAFCNVNSTWTQWMFISSQLNFANVTFTQLGRPVQGAPPCPALHRLGFHANSLLGQEMLTSRSVLNKILCIMGNPATELGLKSCLRGWCLFCCTHGCVGQCLPPQIYNRSVKLVLFPQKINSMFWLKEDTLDSYVEWTNPMKSDTKLVSGCWLVSFNPILISRFYSLTSSRFVYSCDTHFSIIPTCLYCTCNKILFKVSDLAKCFMQFIWKCYAAVVLSVALFSKFVCFTKRVINALLLPNKGFYNKI